MRCDGTVAAPLAQQLVDRARPLRVVPPLPLGGRAILRPAVPEGAAVHAPDADLVLVRVDLRQHGLRVPGAELLGDEDGAERRDQDARLVVQVSGSGEHLSKVDAGTRGEAVGVVDLRRMPDRRPGPLGDVARHQQRVDGRERRRLGLP